MSTFDRTDNFEFYNEMLELGKRGLTLKECGEYHSVDAEDWEEWCQQHKFTEVMLRRGKAQGLSLASEKLIEQIKAGKINAIMFYLKTQGNFNEKSVMKIEESLKVAHMALPEVPSDPVEAAKVYRAFMAEDS